MQNDLVSGLSQSGGPAGVRTPQFLADQLTLYQPEGQIMLRAPEDFQTF